MSVPSLLRLPGPRTPGLVWQDQPQRLASNGMPVEVRLSRGSRKVLYKSLELGTYAELAIRVGV